MTNVSQFIGKNLSHLISYEDIDLLNKDILTTTFNNGFCQGELYLQNLSTGK
ncbi:hypothetical protein RintRC_3577 [Richelia intracellularis]|nr:hypothetical protein RintRC_3577 [Richelia intracellularis]